jgi:hypothetical protein
LATQRVSLLAARLPGPATVYRAELWPIPKTLNKAPSSVDTPTQNNRRTTDTHAGIRVMLKGRQYQESGLENVEGTSLPT